MRTFEHWFNEEYVVHNIPDHKGDLRAAWNAAVEACAGKAEEQKFRGVPTIAREIRKLKSDPEPVV